MKGYPGWFVPLLVTVLVCLVASGLLLGGDTLILRAEWDVPWPPLRDLHVPAAALHALSGFAVLLWTGALWSVHMRAGWRRRQKRVSGSLLGALMLLLGLTAAGVYYIGNTLLANVTAYLHGAAGLAMAVAFTWHWLSARRRRLR